ncbi:MAG: protein arginine kinase [Thermoguttaceae bacterium]
MMQVDALLTQLGPWLRGEGAESDIVISSRIRLARNLSGFPFLVRSKEADRLRVQETVYELLENVFPKEEVEFVDLRQIEPLDRLFLLERQLISRELADSEGPRAVLIDREERFSIMINEEDHLRIQAVRSGLEQPQVWNFINELDDRIESRLHYAFQEKWGYLTACPTNVGTGMRASVMLHLPGLVLSKEIEKVFRGLQKVNLAVRGMYGEGSQAHGDLFQISNQVTLGQSEAEQIQKIQDMVPQIIAYEREAREFLNREKQDYIADRFSRALGLLSTARTISSEETMDHLSSLRLGLQMGFLEEPDIQTINDLLLHIQPAHLQKLAGKTLGQNDRDRARAQYLHKRLVVSS